MPAGDAMACLPPVWPPGPLATRFKKPWIHHPETVKQTFEFKYTDCNSPFAKIAKHLLYIFI